MSFKLNATTVWGSHFARNTTGMFEIDHIPGHLKQLCSYVTQIMKSLEQSFRKIKFDKISQTYTRNSPF